MAAVAYFRWVGWSFATTAVLCLGVAVGSLLAGGMLALGVLSLTLSALAGLMAFDELQWRGRHRNRVQPARRTLALAVIATGSWALVEAVQRWVQQFH